MGGSVVLSKKPEPSIRLPLRITNWIASAAPFYLVPIAASSVISIFLNYLWGGDLLLRGHPLSLVAVFIGTAVGIAAWALYRDAPSADLALRIFLVGNTIAWLVIAGMVWRDGDQFNFGTWLAPLIFLAILIKPPTMRTVLFAADVFAVGLLLISALSHVLHLMGIFTLPTDGAASRLPTFVHGLGLEQRWAGPFASTSDAGPVGGFLLMYAFLRKGYVRWILLVGGLLILVSSSSYTAGFAVILGLLVTMWFLRWPTSPLITRLGKVSLSILTISAGFLFVGATDPTLNARTHIWVDYVNVWSQFPIMGLGTNGILANMDWFTHQHAHSYYVDILTRHGLVGFLATVPLIAFTGVIAFYAGRKGLVAMPGLFTCWALALFGETLIDWRYLGYVLTEFLFIGLIAITYLQRASYDDHSDSAFPWFSSKKRGVNLP